MPRFLHIFSFFYNVFDAADHIEGLLGKIIILTVKDGFEAGNSIFQDTYFPGVPVKTSATVQG